MDISNLELYSFLFGLLGTFILTKFWERYFKLGLDDKNKIQALHNNNSYRIGGIINIFFIMVFIFVLDIFKEFPIFIIFFIPLVLTSILEDFFQTVSVKIRFTIIYITAFLLIYYSESYLREIDIGFLKLIFSNVFFYKKKCFNVCCLTRHIFDILT